MRLKVESDGVEVVVDAPLDVAWAAARAALDAARGDGPDLGPDVARSPADAPIEPCRAPREWQLPKEGSKAHEARQAVKEVLADGPRPKAEVFAFCRAKGIRDGTLNQAISDGLVVKDHGTWRLRRPHMKFAGTLGPRAPWQHAEDELAGNGSNGGS